MAVSSRVRVHHAVAVGLATVVVAGCGNSAPPQARSTETSSSPTYPSATAVPKDVNNNGKADTDPADQSWPGRMTPVYEDATTPEAIQGRDFMQRTDMLARFADDINQLLKLPYDIPLRGSQCDTSNLYWSSGDKAVVLCYEGVAHLITQFTDLGDNDPTQGVYDTELLGFYHESGHMVIDIYDLPAVGREEDDADQVSAYLMLRPNPDGSVDRARLDAITDAARSFAADADNPDGVDDTAMADVHSPTKARLYNLECWTYGADPAYGARLVDQGLLPQDRADVCPDEYAKLRRAWDRLLQPYLKK